jgi:hypothetical protein
VIPLLLPWFPYLVWHYYGNYEFLPPLGQLVLLINQITHDSKFDSITQVAPIFESKFLISSFQYLWTSLSPLLPLFPFCKELVLF